jgi:hypothetical protein
MTEEKKELKQCSGCRSFMLLEHYKFNRKGEYNKTCISCAKTRKKRIDKKKCEHNKRKSRCKDCGGSLICPHNRIKSACKDCGGSQICPHNRQKSACKECGGSQICKHNRIKSNCKDCGGSQICKHNKRRRYCKECGGSAFCKHNRQKHICKDCGGGSVCPHNKIKSYCKECGGGSICEHNRIKSQCKDCGGSSICEHNRQKIQCKDCDPIGHLRSIVSHRIYSSLQSNKSKRSIEYLGCNIKDFKEHIESQFKEGMTWENHGEWHIDHIVPIKYKEDGEAPTLEDTIERLHWSNTQPLWASENISKGNRFIG